MQVARITRVEAEPSIGIAKCAVRQGSAIHRRVGISHTTNPRVELMAARAQQNGNFQPTGASSFLPAYTPYSSAPAQANQSFKASGKTVVITGGSQGIGRATALLFAKKGFNVVVAARDLSKLEYVAHDCAQIAGRAGSSLAVQCDVTSERDMRNLANTAYAKFESVDVVVSSAGIISRGRLLDTPFAEAKRLMDVNYIGAYLLAQSFIPQMAKESQRRRGLDRPSIIMINSFAGKVPLKHMSAFTASKYALAGFTEAIRTEAEPLGVHIGQVYPGLVKSNFMERAEFFGPNKEEERRAFRQQIRSLPFSQTPAEVADCVFDASRTKQHNVVVGLPFMAADAAFRLTGANVSALPFL